MLAPVGWRFIAPWKKTRAALFRLPTNLSDWRDVQRFFLPNGGLWVGVVGSSFALPLRSRHALRHATPSPLATLCPRTAWHDRYAVHPPTLRSTCAHATQCMCAGYAVRAPALRVACARVCAWAREPNPPPRGGRARVLFYCHVRSSETIGLNWFARSLSVDYDGVR